LGDLAQPGVISWKNGQVKWKVKVAVMAAAATVKKTNKTDKCRNICAQILLFASRCGTSLERSACGRYLVVLSASFQALLKTELFSPSFPAHDCMITALTFVMTLVMWSCIF